MSAPAISVVVATYNRPDALRCALESVRRQSFGDWEVVVVGDRCTDSTRDVVASFADPRLRYIDLARNIGEQSGPNNIGIHAAHAPLIAFLNHDDLWFPDHLQVAFEALIASAADLVFTACLTVHPKAGPFDVDQPLVTLESVGVDGTYDPSRVDCVVPASTWLARRDALEALRGWRPARDLRVEPSQDLLARAVRRGFALRAVPAVTVVTIPSGVRPGSYSTGAATEQEAFLPRLGDVDWRLRVTASDPRTTAAGAARHARIAPLRTKIWVRLLRFAPLVGRSAREVDFGIRRRLRPGGYVRSLRRIRGLHDTRDTAGDHERVRFAEARRHSAYRLGDCHSCGSDGAGIRYLTAGWAGPERWGVWNDGTHAQLVFELTPVPCGGVTVHLGVSAYLPPGVQQQRVHARVAGRPAGELVLDETCPVTVWTMAVPASVVRRTLVLDLDLPDAISPVAAEGVPDARQLAISLASIRITSNASFEEPQDRPRYAHPHGEA